MLIPNLIGIALIGYGVMVLICQDADNLYYGATCRGVLVSTKTLKSLKHNDDLPQQTHKFRYEVDGVQYEGWHPQGISDQNIYIIGRTYPLRYHVDNPKEFMITVMPETKRFCILTIIGGLAIIVLALNGFLVVTK